MLKNYFKIALRNLLRQKTYSFINIFGFAIGLAVCLIISFYVIDDLTYDNFHDKPEDVYHMLTVDNSEADGALSYSITSGPLMAGLVENVPEVIAVTRLTGFGRVNVGQVIENPEEQIEDQIQPLTLAVDEDFFKVFSFKILAGESENPMQDLSGIYLTPEIAEAVFPGEDPIGKPVLAGRLENAFVAGIVEAPPANSHLQFGMILPLNIERNAVWWDSWENLALTGYFRLHPNANPLQVKQKITSYARNGGLAEVFEPDMQPLEDVHLGSSHLRYDFMNVGKNDKMKVYTLAIIAIFVLIIASINFINLSSARAARRAREVGLRKVIGGNRNQLFWQFLGESVMITFIAMILALAMFEIALPHLNNFLQKNLTLNLVENYQFILFIILTSIVVGILSGIYPALILSGFNPLSVIHGNFKSSKKGVLLRRVLVVGQFAVSIALIIAVFIVLTQIRYLNSIDLGYNREDVAVLPVFDNAQGPILKDKIEKLSSVESVGTISNMPGGTLVRLEVVPEGHNMEKGMMFDRLMIDDDLVETLQIGLLEGRDFSADFPSDVQNSVLINETAMKTLGWADPIGKKLVMIDENEAQLERTIIGVIKDVNLTTVRRKVNPMVVVHSGEFIPRLLIKLQPDNQEYAIEEINLIFLESFPDANINILFFNDFFNFQFRQDRAFAINIAVFSVLAILIACLGLFGLASFTTQQRQREIAVRKVLGSSVKSIVFLLTKEFARWVIVANLIAWPLAYYGMTKWLENFVYRTSFNPLIFVAAGIAALIISILTISFQTIKAANINPASALQYE
ncbi:MAG: ABC transporter permease [Candidatus Cloacimonetes bacterium]|nr:ABC transporter permease [Candidatus Cloacimonadota bacterium]